jgi:hypothetical protein
MEKARDQSGPLDSLNADALRETQSSLLHTRDIPAVGRVPILTHCLSTVNRQTIPGLTPSGDDSSRRADSPRGGDIPCITANDLYVPR